MAGVNPEHQTRRAITAWRVFGGVGVVAALGGLVYAGVSRFCPVPNLPVNAVAETAPPKEPTVGNLPLFFGWPKDTKPDAVVVLSGQTFGFLQPCGCSRPQFGGLERRANFIQTLRQKGWPVVGVDLGDQYPAKGMVPEQSLLRYSTAMNALRDMGYIAVGVGKTEFGVGLHKLTAEYALQKEQPPFTLAGNVVGLAGGQMIPRAAFFPPPPGATRPLIGLAEVADVGAVTVGVVSVVGPTVAKEAVKADPGIEFEGNKKVLGDATAALDNHPKKPQLRVLLYQGTAEEAKRVAEDWPQFSMILCLSEDSEPPQFPARIAGKNHPAGQQTLVIEVGHKGRYIGIVGAFKKADGTFDYKYQLVPLGEEYLTPENPGAEKNNRVLQLLEEYARQVKDRNMLAKVVKQPNNQQLHDPGLSYIGSEKCMGCHAAEYKKWQEVRHSHAMHSLEVQAKRPGLRNFDPECVVCHTVGYKYKTGYENAEKTAFLKNVGCESCHGPGSGHAASPRKAELLALLRPWKQGPNDKLPDVAMMDKIAKLNPAERGQVAMPPAQQRMVNVVSRMCMECHDAENDPHFDLFKYWPQINHSGLSNGGLPPLPKR